MNVNLENLEILKQKLRDLNLGIDVDFYQMSLISHELITYLNQWSVDDSTNWTDFIRTNHLLQNKNLCQKVLDLKSLINLRNSLYYKTFDRSQSFRCLKDMQNLELKIKSLNRSRAAAVKAA